MFGKPRDGYVLVAEQGHVGRLSEKGVTICGFASKGDAVSAASVAFHALRAHLADRAGKRLGRAATSGERAKVSVYADGDRSGSFCFELHFPPAGPSTVRLNEAHKLTSAEAPNAQNPNGGITP